jgi:hypothetical protein
MCLKKLNLMQIIAKMQIARKEKFIEETARIIWKKKKLCKIYMTAS